MTDFVDIKRKRKTNIDLGNMMFGKIPPQDVKVEMAILGVILIDRNCFYRAVERLFPEIFYTDAHQKIYKAIRMLYDANRPIDMLTLVNQLQKNEELDLVGGMYYISKLTDGVTSGANIETHISIIAEHYIKREEIRLSGEIINDAYSDEIDAFDILNKADIGFQKIQESVLIGTTKDIRYFSINVLKEHANTKATGVLGIKTKLNAIDGVMCGLVSPDLIVLAARPSQGKTAMALSITYNTSILDNIACAWFSLEMDGTQIVRRLVSMDTGIQHERIRTGQTTHDEDIMIGESVEKISNCNIFIEDKTSMSIRSIRTRAYILKKKYKIQYIVVDYIQLMEGLEAKNKNREQVISEISRGLKMLAKELEMPIIALSQLSREVEKRPDKMPQLSDLRESGAIEQDADEVIFLMRPEYYKMENSVEIDKIEYHPKGLCIASIAKNRHGETKYRPLRFTGSIMRFSDMESPFTKEIPQNFKPQISDDNPF